MAISSYNEMIVHDVWVKTMMLCSSVRVGEMLLSPRVLFLSPEKLLW